MKKNYFSIHPPAETNSLFFEMQILGNVLVMIILLHIIYHDAVFLRSN